MFRRFVVVGAVLLAACGPMRTVDRCRVDGDCLGILVCVEELCVLPMNDAGVMSARDSGVQPVADASVEFDAGVDAGAVDAGEVDAGVDAGACVPSIELCNGIDDDCNGEIDEGAALFPSDGGVFEFDGGTAGASGMCNSGVGACASSGMTSCVGGQLACSGIAGTPGVERCNGRDDDCDGQTDEADPGLCANAGELCTNGSCACPSGQVVCGGSCVALGGACTVGVGACQRSGVASCTSSMPACSATAGTPSAEVCNSIDDDCDGQTDEVGSGLCPATGQSCNAGTCECPAGQSVCNGACKVLTAEVCDGIDNDCNGQTDEGVTIGCLADPDDDGWAGAGAATSQQCPVLSRQARGLCPVGYVSQPTSGGIDCDSSNGAVWRVVASRADADGDAYCVAGTDTNDCVGNGPLAGRRFSQTCIADDCNDASALVFRLATTKADADGDTFCVANTDAVECIGNGPAQGRRLATTCNTLVSDCNDNLASVFQLVSTAPDADNDQYCASAPTMECMGNTPAPGRRLASSCLSTTDCNDASASVYQLKSLRPDLDGDGYCTGTATNTCVGATVPTGQRLATTCAVFGFESVSIDCDDASGTKWANQSVQSDADNDGWCVNDAVSQCLGSTAPAGKRFSTSCAGIDCKDTNANATSVCTISLGYATQYHTQTCPNSPTDYTVLTTQACPAGFSPGVPMAEKASSSLAGFCTATNANTVRQSCNGFDGSTCRVVADCIAN